MTLQQLTVADIALFIGSLGAIAAPIIATIKMWRGVQDRMSKLETRCDKIETDIKCSKEERMITASGLLAVLRGMHEMGANGPVSEGIKELEDFLLQKSHD